MNQKHYQNKLSECQCKLDGRKCNSNQKWNIDKCQCEYKNPTNYPVRKKDYV